MDDTWNTLVASLPGAHILQTREWAQIKAYSGWSPLYVVWPSRRDGFRVIAASSNPSIGYSQDGYEGPPAAAALLLQRSLPIPGFSGRVRMLYSPRGPLLNWGDSDLRRRVLGDLRNLARRERAIFVKIDPQVPLGSGVPGTPQQEDDPLGVEVNDCLVRNGWLYSDSQVQFRNTVLIDLTLPEDELLARMKQKTRYNIRLAERKGVQVRLGGEADFPLLYQMFAETSLRDGFVIREQGYYQKAWTTFLQSGMGEPLIAEVDGEPVAGVVIVRFAGVAYYLYGMSRSVHREKMPNVLLQWEAMRRAKAAGCRVYDLWGAPEVFDESDPMWGVYRFKEGLGGVALRTVGAWDLPVNLPLYRLFTRVVPRILDLMRRRGKARTQEALG